MNILTTLKFLEDKGYLTHSQTTSNWNDDIVNVGFYLTKTDVAELEIHSDNVGNVSTIIITPEKNVFAWKPDKLGEDSDDLQILLTGKELYLLESVLNLIEDSEIWEQHVSAYEELSKVYRKQVSIYKEKFLEKDYKVFTKNVGANGEICTKKTIFCNRPYSLSNIELTLDCLLLEIVLTIYTDFGKQKIKVPFDSHYANECIDFLFATDDLWRPIIIENLKKMNEQNQ